MSDCFSEILRKPQKKQLMSCLGQKSEKQTKTLYQIHRDVHKIKGMEMHTHSFSHTTQLNMSRESHLFLLQSVDGGGGKAVC